MSELLSNYTDMKRTDTDRINALNILSHKYGNGWILRNSYYGRGMRLHESEHPDAVPDVRDAIDNFLDAGETKNH